jgi:glycosyltransferase involved in cell wall biosynthesis
MIEGRDIVCVSFVTWDDHWGTPQQLMSRLAKRNRVLYVDQAISPLSFVTGIRSRGAVMRQLRRWRQGYREVATNVYAAAPPPILPLRSFKPVNAINAFILRRWLRRQTGRLGFRHPIVWNFQPLAPHVAVAVDPALTLFHCVDEYAAVPHWWHSSAAAAAREAECCRESDIVICVGRGLTAARQKLNSNTHFVPNAADVAHFATALRPDLPIPDDIADLDGRVIGYIGVVDFRFDSGLLSYLARERPDWSFAIVGPVKGGARGLDALRALPNVRFLGNKPIEVLPAYARRMDVCLLPYVIDGFTSYIFPLKLYEYMAAGKPIVSTDLNEMRPYAGGGLTIARGRDEFLRAIEHELEADSDERAAARERASRAHSWDHRLEEISALIASLPHRHTSQGRQPPERSTRSRHDGAGQGSVGGSHG